MDAEDAFIGGDFYVAFVGGSSQRGKGRAGHAEAIAMEQAQEEFGKPFPMEAEYREKSARLVELDMLLNMENKHDSDLEEEQEETPAHHRNRDEEVL